jgi:hypothetical protein
LLKQAVPLAQVQQDPVALGGGLDVVTTPLFTKPGTCRLAYNYEAATGGGYERIGGIERFDGRTAPNLASYVYLQCGANTTAIVGDTVTGATSAATGKVIYVAGRLLAVTMVTGTFGLEVLNVGGSPVGTVTALDATVDGFLDNELAALAAVEYRVAITRVPGSGRVRGVAVLNDEVFAWRNNAGGTALVLHKATSSGWTAVALLYELSFTGGSVQPAEASTLTQGGTTATVRRVVLESGDWGTSNAAGRYIITAPSGGVFSGGALATAGAGTVPAAGPGVYQGTQITLAPDGRIDHDVTSFSGAANAFRLYGCDGINREFELQGDVLVPLTTGMPVRASCVRAHRNHLFYSYRGSLQHSGIGAPYQWTVISGAAELGAGDTITNLVSIGGSEASAALMVLCQNAIRVLYGDSAASPWLLKPLSNIQGAAARSAQDIAGVVALDAPGFVRLPPTQAFGNFRWDSVSQQIEPIARGQSCECSVWVADRSKYRVFFEDGTAVCGVPVAKGQFEWTTINYGRTICCAVHAEIAGNARTFVADTDGWVYEADVGRSFAGDAIPYALRLNELSQRSSGVIKQYARMSMEAQAQSAFTLSAQADFFDGDEQIDPTQPQTLPQYGNGLLWDLANWDQAYWDINETARKRFPLEGQGTSVAISLAGESANELPHTLRALTVSFITRRQAR